MPGPGAQGSGPTARGPGPEARGPGLGLGPWGPGAGPLCTRLWGAGGEGRRREWGNGGGKGYVELLPNSVSDRGTISKHPNAIVEHNAVHTPEKHF